MCLGRVLWLTVVATALLATTVAAAADDSAAAEADHEDKAPLTRLQHDRDLAQLEAKIYELQSSVDDLRHGVEALAHFVAASPADEQMPVAQAAVRQYLAASKRGGGKPDWVGSRGKRYLHEWMGSRGRRSGPHEWNWMMGSRG